jgi:hypothetical protein
MILLHSWTFWDSPKHVLVMSLVAKMMINGLDAVVMFDTGSTSDAVSPEFTQIVNMKIHSLDEPMGIQLGCKGEVHCAHIMVGT